MKFIDNKLKNSSLTFEEYKKDYLKSIEEPEKFWAEKAKTLLWIKNWDFSWQEQYHYTDFISLPKGTRLDAKVVWDNSAENPNNPSSPPKRVRWGLQSTDEMGSMTLLVKPKRARDIGTLNSAMVRHGRDHAAARAVQRNRGLGQQLVDAAMREDKDKDGKIARDEAPRWLRANFNRIDTDSDGKLSRKELEAAVARMRNR